ncbi:MAG: hypothetical protein ACRYF4_10325 [Janthinobacterium lividum]
MPFSSAFRDLDPSSRQPVHVLYRDGEPTNEVLDGTPTPPIALTPEGQDKAEKAARKEATRLRREGQHARLRGHIEHHLALYGPNGKPETLDGNVSNRGWNSRNPNERFMDLVVGIGSVRHVNEKTAVVPDIYAFEEARAVLASWGRRSKDLPPAALTATFVRWAPAPGSSVYTDHVVPGLVVTAKVLNDRCAAYLANPEWEQGNFEDALHKFVEKQYMGRTARVVMAGGHEEPHDVLTDFAIELIKKVRAGTYEHHGKIESWIGTIWKTFFADFQERYFIERNVSLVLNQDDTFDEWGESSAPQTGTIDPCIVDSQQSRREVTESLNSPAYRLSRIYRDLEDPTTEFGKLPADIKKMLLLLRTGMGKAKAALQAGVNERTARRCFEKIADLRESTFVHQITVAA